MKLALIAVAGLAITAGASAGNGDWAWTFSDTAGGSGMDNGSGPGGGLNIIGGDAGFAGFSAFSTVASVDQTISFTGLYTSLDSGNFDQAFYFVDDPTSGAVVFAQNDSQGTFNLNFAVLAGQTFGFGVSTMDGLFGAGTLNVSNISPRVPTPGALGLFGIAGLAATRRRRG